MFRNKKSMLGIVLALVMVLTIAVPVFADSEDGIVEDPQPVKFFNQPIVQLIAGFFNNLLNPPVEVLTDPDLPLDTGIGEDPLIVDGSDLVGEPEPEITAEPVVSPVEMVASMHEEDNLGFGEIVKLMEILSSNQAACIETGENCDVTYVSLLEEYKAGSGMGELFAKYGKPENVGVGQIRKEFNLKEKTNNGQAKEKKTK